MDPNQTLLDIILTATSIPGSPEHARLIAEQLRDQADDLATWIERGGFTPDDPRDEQELTR